MYYSEENNRYEQLTKKFTVSADNLNKDGVLAISKMLNEIVKLNDRAIKKAYGVLDYDKISTTHYEFDFPEYAVLGDVIEIETLFTITKHNKLLIDTVVRTKTDISKTIGEGRFIYQPILTATNPNRPALA